MTGMELTPDEIGRAEFRLVRKGYDPDQVRRLLTGVAERLENLTERAEAGSQAADGLVAAARDDAAAIVAAGHTEAEALVEAGRAEAQRRLDELQGRLAVEEATAAERVAAAERDAAERTARLEQEAQERAAAVERDAAERAAMLDAAAQQAVASMEHQAGERAERIVAAAADEAGTIVAAAEAAAVAREREAVTEARDAAESEKARHREDLERLIERVLLLRAHVVELEAHVDGQEALVDQVQLLVELHRQRLAATVAGLQALHDDPEALAGIARPTFDVEASLPELSLLRPLETTEPSDDLDIAGELAGMLPDETETAFDPDPELVRRFFEEDVYADERWKPRRDRRRRSAVETAEVPVVVTATLPATGDEADASMPADEPVGTSPSGPAIVP
jgi:DivIVA domain-containing protein